jgi:hypothetical protein
MTLALTMKIPLSRKDPIMLIKLYHISYYCGRYRKIYEYNIEDSEDCTPEPIHCVNLTGKLTMQDWRRVFDKGQFKEFWLSKDVYLV